MHDSSLPTLRREVIAVRLDAGLSVVASELAQEFQISEDAIRRDLRALAAKGRCKRVYGGALPVSPASGALSERVPIQAREKILLARTGAQLIQARGLIFLDGGTTNLALVAELPENKFLTIATNSVPVANAVLNRKGLKLLMVEDISVETLRERDPKKLIPPLHGALIKNEQDVHLFERLAFMARREGR